MYPSSEGSTFDMDYYVNKHLPMVGELMGEVILGTSLEKGVASAAPGAPAPFMAIAHIYCNSPEDFTTSFGQNIEKIGGDIPNYTNVEPVIQISEVMG